MVGSWKQQSESLYMLNWYYLSLEKLAKGDDTA